MRNIAVHTNNRIFHASSGKVIINGTDATLLASFDLERKEAGLPIIDTASLFERALIERLQQFPDDLRIIDRHKFERLVAELFSGFGYQVELSKRTRDGGKDITAIKHDKVGLKFLIECKRPDPGNPVSVSTVRELYGVKNDEKVSKAILVTTTRFTQDAKLFSDKHPWELELQDYEGIRSWIDDYLKK